MTTNTFFDSLTSIITDLSKDLPAEQRYQHLLNAILRLFTCDAAALLRLNGSYLHPLAIKGLSSDTMGRRFLVSEHPRLARLLTSREPVRFAADSELPDPYDGLIEGSTEDLHVHDCMGISLYVDNKPWGALTLDAMETGTFDEIDPTELRTFISLTEATVKAAARIDELAARIEREQLVTQTLQEESGKFEIIGDSPPIKRLKEEIAIVAQSHLTVLATGETGVGKELVARQVHQLSPRRKKPLVYVNCAALPENIAESELFGHTKGAFTGATTDRAGKFEIADGGTLFLDEVGELPLLVQAKLLRAIQSGDIQRIGSDEAINTDVRIVAATNRDLQQEVTSGRFRADLYHRLSVYPIQVPPLRERGNDILLIAGFLLEANQRRLGVQGLRLANSAKQALLHYEWPGNVRELEHMLSRASLNAMAQQGRAMRTIILDANHLDISTQSDTANAVTTAHNPHDTGAPFTATSEGAAQALTENTNLKEAIDSYQTNLIQAALDRNKGNQAAAAKELGLNRSNFHRLIKRLDII